MIYRHVGPRRDHVELDAAEQRALVDLERVLSTPEGAEHRGRRLRSARVRRLAPWLLPVGGVLMVVTIPISVPLTFVCSLLTAAGLAGAIDRTDR
jgi:hypothetical protein